MTTRTLTVSRLALAVAAGAVILFANDNMSSSRGEFGLITQADARIGRPLTPGSVAGVARRTERRAYRRGAIVGGTVVGAGAYYGAGGYYGGGAAGTGLGAYGPGPVAGSVIVNPTTGRYCTFEQSGWHWCWTP